MMEKLKIMFQTTNQPGGVSSNNSLCNPIQASNLTLTIEGRTLAAAGWSPLMVATITPVEAAGAPMKDDKEGQMMSNDVSK